MKFRLPTSLSLFAVPVLCLALLGLAWFLVRRGGEGAAQPMPTLRLLADERLRPSLVGLVAAFERRAGLQVQPAYLPANAVEAALRDGADHHLVLLANEGDLPPSLAGHAPVGMVGGIRVILLPDGTAPDDAARFLDFLQGPFAKEILARSGTGRPIVPLPNPP